MRTVYWLLLLTITVVITAVVVNRRMPVGTATAAAARPPIGGAPVGTVKDIMRGIVDPQAAIVWDAVGTEHRKTGTIEKVPKTDEEWARVEYSALVLAEAANLLKMAGRHIARPEEANSTRWPGAPELTPAQIEEKLASDPVRWSKAADALQAAAVKAIAAARAHDKDGVFNVGEEIDNACESCHLVYWYPEDRTLKVPAPAPASK